MEKILNFIGGELIPPHSNRFLENKNPATGQTYSFAPDSDAQDMARAIEAAQKAFKPWSETSPIERAKILKKIAALIEENLISLAQAESVDTGKPLKLSQTIDIPRSVLNFNFFADCMTQFANESFTTDIHTLNYVIRQSLGVVGCISPWNLPLYLLTWKIAPALVTGNTVVAKPSEMTPMTAFLLSQIVIKAGLPNGVLNIVHGLGPKVGAALVKHPDIKAISFTGSTKVGTEIAELAAPQFKKTSLEMGGKNAAIIFADCDFEKAIQTTLRSAFSNQGQICLCTSRIFIEKSIYEKFKSRLLDLTKNLRQGDPLSLQTDQGALVSEVHFNKVLSYLELAKKEGAKILTGGKPNTSLTSPFNTGWFIEPTLLEGLSPKNVINQEEIFGPVATLLPFESEAEVLEAVNQTRYGLATSIWTENLSRAQRLSSKLESGLVWINCWMVRDLRTPFGGIKDSGLGREGGVESLRFFTETKNICIQTH